jgi:hypothetical protein
MDRPPNTFLDDLGTLGRVEHRHNPCPRQPTTGNSIGLQQICITHPFHPLRGQSFPLVVSKKLWGESRVTIQLPDGTPRSVPINWTDATPGDPYVSVALGRSRFRVEDLLALAKLIRAGRNGR